MKSALTIAGSDSSGGAGIQADIKTMTALGVFAQSAITALTAQNTLGVSGVEVVSASFVREQIDRVFEDIRPDAVKIGMIPSAELVEGIAEGLLAHKACHIVLDPVMVATSGASLSSNEAVQAMVDRLFPLAEVVTPKVVEEPKPVAKQETPATAPKKETKKAAATPFEPDSVNYKIVGTKATHTIQEGETLTKVALRFYGTKALWPYIVKYNSGVIKNPDHVPYGTVIKIPELEKK